MSRFISFLFILVLPAHAIKCQEAIFQKDSTLSSLSAHFIQLEINQTEAGQVLFISAIISHAGRGETSVHVQLDLPNGWLAMEEDRESLVIAAQTPYIYLNTIQIPPQALVGSYPIKLLVTSSEKDENLCMGQVICEVSPFNRFIFTAEEIPPLLAEGEIFNLLLHYSNEGNTLLPLQIEVNNNFIDAESQNYFISLNPGEKKDQEIPIFASFESRSHAAECACVFVKIKNMDTDELLEYRTFIFDILPVGKQAADPYLRLPATFSLGAAKISDQTTIFCELSGEGVVDPEKEVFTEFFFRVPFYNQAPSAEEVASFYWDLNSPHWDLAFGDTGYSLGPLSEDYWYARGGMLTLYQEGWNTGLFYAQDILSVDCKRKEWGTFLNAEASDQLEIGGNYLYKQNDKRNDAHIAEIDFDIQLSSLISMELNLAHNFNSFHDQKKHSGYRIKCGGNGWNKNSFLLERIYVGKYLDGYYDGLNQWMGSLDQPLSQHYSANFCFNHLHYSLNNQSCSCFKFKTPKMKQTSFQGQLNYFNNKGFSFGVNSFYLKAHDCSRHSLFNFRQYWSGIACSYAQPSYFFLFMPSLGVEEKVKTKEKNRFLQRYSFNLNYIFSFSFNLNLFFEFGNINLLKARAWRYTLGSQLSYRVNYRTVVSGFIQTNQYTLLGNWTNQYALSIQHSFRNGHQFNLNIQQIHDCKCRGSNETQFLISYTIPFGLKLMKRRDQGSVSGRIYQASDEEPVSRALVSLNEQALLTDEKGYFSFQGMPNGVYRFKADKLLCNQVSPCSEIFPLFVRNGNSTFIDVPVYQSSILEGYVMFFTYKELEQGEVSLQDKWVEEDVEIQPICIGGLGKIVLKLQHSSNLETFDCETDSSGYFCFSNLYPGEWHITLDPETLPRGYQCASPLGTIEISENEIHRIQLDIVPSITKEIHMEWLE